MTFSNEKFGQLEAVKIVTIAKYDVIIDQSEQAPLCMINLATAATAIIYSLSFFLLLVLF